MNIQNLIGFNEPKTLSYGDENSPLLLQVHSTSSKIARDAFRAMQISVFTYMKDENNIVELDGKKNLKMELLSEVGIDYLASLVTDWDGLMDADKKVPFDRNLLKQAIQNNDDLGVLINDFASNEGNFH